jgi:hypothetical protein
MLDAGTMPLEILTNLRRRKHRPRLHALRDLRDDAVADFRTGRHAACLRGFDVAPAVFLSAMGKVVVVT